MTLDLGPYKWAHQNVHAEFRGSQKPRIAGISGGSTSGMMAALLDTETVLSFQNTGREHPATYDFLEHLAEGLERPIVWLEYRPPKEKGGRPCESRFEIVDVERADKSGGPFEMLMEALNAFRATQKKGPIAPWWRSRICTTYMKTRTARAYVETLGWERWNELVGLRADEPDRVGKLRVGVPRRIGRSAPLYDNGITKEDVRMFWEKQSFRLELPSHLGNCTACFLKDQSDLSRALSDLSTDAPWWQEMEEKWPGWGGKNFAGYKVLRGEAASRRRIEDTLRRGVVPEKDADIPDPKRFRLVVIQERKRLAGDVLPFACECEGAQGLANMDEEEEDDYILSLPEADPARGLTSLSGKRSEPEEFPVREVSSLSDKYRELGRPS